MSDVMISEMGAAVLPLDGTELIPIVQGAANRTVASGWFASMAYADEIAGVAGAALPETGGTMTGVVVYTGPTAATVVSSSRVAGDINNRWQRQLGGAAYVGNGVDFPKSFLRCDGEAASRDYSNTWLGYQAGELYGAQTDSRGYANTGVGFQSLASLTGASADWGEGNTAVGYHSGGNLTIGDRNTMVGVQALGSATTARYSTAVGYHAAIGMTGGGTGMTAVGFMAAEAATQPITAVGYLAGRNTTAGSGTFVGAGSGQFVTSGDFNTALGKDSLGGNTNVTGQSNTALGYRCGFGLVGGDYNVMVGYSAGLNVSSGNRNICVGGNATGPTSGSDNALFGYARTLPSNTASGQLNFFGVITATGLVTTPLLSLGTAAGGVAFYGAPGIVRQTGVAVTVAAVHAALVALNLIGV